MYLPTTVTPRARLHISKLPRTLLPRTRVNEGTRDGRKTGDSPWSRIRAYSPSLQLRGPLPYHKAIRGTLITLGNLSKGCTEAALFPGAAPVGLING